MFGHKEYRRNQMESNKSFVELLLMLLLTVLRKSPNKNTEAK